MKRAGKIILAFALLAWLLWLFIPRSPSPQPAMLPAVENRTTNLPVIVAAIPAPLLLGETILRGYATSVSTPENDLTLLAHLMDNFTLLVKSSAQLPMSANEDWAAAFRGKNPAHEMFLPETHVALNAQGQLVDRWQTPLFFHALGGHRFEIRSAGPDKKMWTDDDLHRNANGTFRRGAELNPPSLLEGAQGKTSR